MATTTRAGDEPSNGNDGAEGPPREIVTADLVEDVFGLPCRIIDDPESHTPLVIRLVR